MKLKTFSIDRPNMWVGGVSIVRAANKQEAFEAFSKVLNGHPAMKGEPVGADDEIIEVDDKRGNVTILLNGDY